MMSDKPLVSVCWITYNYENYILDASMDFFNPENIIPYLDHYSRRRINRWYGKKKF
jgi:hypothetical protein